jgi:PPOX class probable FMN-dependent enzyme
MTPHNRITSIEQLDALYDAPAWAARAKECDTLTPPYCAFIEAAPYLMLATAGKDDVDCSSRGGARGFVRVVDEKTLLIPDYPGNDRIESLRNIVRDPRVALHFLLPGCGDTLRVKGTAAISVDPELLLSFAAENGGAPKAVIVVTITSAYYHCGMAIKRARLWDSSTHVGRATLPSVNAMLASAQWKRTRDAIVGLASNGSST